MLNIYISILSTMLSAVIGVDLEDIRKALNRELPV